MENKIEILFENDRFVAINKPAGLVVHPDGRTKEETVAGWFVENYPNSKEVGEDLELSDGIVIKRPGIVHRLDRETSGVLLLAKTNESYKYLKRQFKERDVQKTYLAFVYGKPKDERGIIDKPIGKSRDDFRQRTTSIGARGKIRGAKTVYKVLESGKGFSLLELFPKTGRTHQIRVHLKSINHPIVADSLYAENLDSALGFERLALHAKSIKFKDYKEGDILVEAPLPEDFKEAVRKIRN